VAKTRSEYNQKIDTLKRIIKKVIAQCLNHELLLNILTNPTFQLRLVPPGVINAEAMTVAVRNVIFVGIPKCDTISEAHVTHLLSNELYSLANFVRNCCRSTLPQLSLRSMLHLTIPFTTPDLQIDGASQKRLIQIFDGAVKGLGDNLDLDRLIRLMTSYQPREYHYEMTMAQFRQRLQHRSDHIYYSVTEQCEIRLLEQKQLSAERINIIVRYSLDDSIPEKAKAFKYDMLKIVDRHMVSKDTVYRTMSNHKNLNEFCSSFVATYRPIMYAVLPALCDYMDNFFCIEGYCPQPESQISGPKI
jgi:hypothetical protein